MRHLLSLLLLLKLILGTVDFFNRLTSNTSQKNFDVIAPLYHRYDAMRRESIDSEDTASSCGESCTCHRGIPWYEKNHIVPFAGPPQEYSQEQSVHAPAIKWTSRWLTKYAKRASANINIWRGMRKLFYTPDKFMFLNLNGDAFKWTNNVDTLNVPNFCRINELTDLSIAPYVHSYDSQDHGLLIKCMKHDLEDKKAYTTAFSSTSYCVLFPIEHLTRACQRIIQNYPLLGHDEIITRLTKSLADTSKPASKSPAHSLSCWFNLLSVTTRLRQVPEVLDLLIKELKRDLMIHSKQMLKEILQQNGLMLQIQQIVIEQCTRSKLLVQHKPIHLSFKQFYKQHYTQVVHTLLSYKDEFKELSIEADAVTSMIAKIYFLKHVHKEYYPEDDWNAQLIEDVMFKKESWKIEQNIVTKVDNINDDEEEDEDNEDSFGFSYKDLYTPQRRMAELIEHDMMDLIEARATIKRKLKPKQTLLHGSSSFIFGLKLIDSQA